MSVNQRLGEYIKFKRIKQTEIAIKLGVTQAYISGIITGKDNLGMNQLQKVLELFPDLNADWLLVGRGEMLVPGHGLQKEYEIKEMVQAIVKEEMKNYINEQKNKK